MNLNEKEYVEKVLHSYEEKKVTKLDELRELDKKAKKGPMIFTYLFGAIGALILGFGMCVAMKVILADLMWLGIVIGIIGILMICFNYFIYVKLLNRSKQKYAMQIKALSDDLLNN